MTAGEAVAVADDADERTISLNETLNGPTGLVAATEAAVDVVVVVVLAEEVDDDCCCCCGCCCCCCCCGVSVTVDEDEAVEDDDVFGETRIEVLIDGVN